MADYALYIDDSGHPDDQPFVVVAGFIATEAQWLLFEPEWKSALQRNGISKPFHMTDFMSQVRQTKERSRILAELTNVILSNTQACFVGGVEISGYKKVNHEYALEECLGAPYALASRALSIALNGWSKDNLRPEDHLLLFAESGTKHRGDMMEVFKRDNLPEPVSVPKSLPSVQPADMLAWEVFHNFTGANNGKRILRLAKRRNNFGMVFSEKDLRDMCTDTSQSYVIPRSKLAPSSTITFHSSPKRPRRRTIK